tara:strand:+ start:3266 stop:3670 length:405 start_codon:yes stop_codon:yes gene_type:complete
MADHKSTIKNLLGDEFIQKAEQAHANLVSAENILKLLQAREDFAQIVEHFSKTLSRTQMARIVGHENNRLFTEAENTVIIKKINESVVFIKDHYAEGTDKANAMHNLNYVADMVWEKTHNAGLNTETGEYDFID